MGKACSAHGLGEKFILGFGGETLGKETIGETRHRWEYNITMDHQEVGCGVME